MLKRHFTSTVSISRPVVTGNKTAFEEVATLVPCHIQPLAPVYQNGEWGRMQKEFLLLTKTEVRVGDKLVDQDGTAYEVFGSAFFTFRGKPHYEAQLRSA